MPTAPGSGATAKYPNPRPDHAPACYKRAVGFPGGFGRGGGRRGGGRRLVRSALADPAGLLGGSIAIFETYGLAPAGAGPTALGPRRCGGAGVAADGGSGIGKGRLSHRFRHRPGGLDAGCRPLVHRLLLRRAPRGGFPVAAVGASVRRVHAGPRPRHLRHRILPRRRRRTWAATGCSSLWLAPRPPIPAPTPSGGSSEGTGWRRASAPARRGREWPAGSPPRSEQCWRWALCWAWA